MSKKPLTEEQSRKQLLGWARQYGAEEQLLKIFARYDDLLRGCKTQEERSAVQVMGNLEIHNFFGGKGALEVNGMTIKEDPAYEEQQKRLREEELKKAALTKK
jgi:hypothetical protein